MKNIKRLFLVVILSMLALVITGCEKNKTEEKEYVQPAITNGSDIVYTTTYNGNTINVTKEEVYKFVRYSGGLTLLLQKIDDDLLKSYVSRISSEVGGDNYDYYLSRYNRMVYSTNDQAEIDKLSETEKQEDLEDFNYTLEIMGYDKEDGIVNYIKTLAARDLFAYEYLIEHKDDKFSDYQIADETVEEYYNENKYTSACTAIIVSYDSMTEFNEAIDKAGLAVIDSKLVLKSQISGLEKDYGQLDIDEVENVQAKFESLYNTKYNVKSGAIREYNYNDYIDNASTLIERLYSMKAGDYTYTASSDSTGIGTVYSIIYKVTDADAKEYNELTTTEKESWMQKYIKDYVQTATNITSILVEYRDQLGIKFYDQELAYDYYSSYDSEYDFASVESDGNKLVEYKNENKEKITITADDFYDYATGISKEYYIMSAAIVEIEQYLDSYTLLYGSEKDIDANASVRKASFYDTLESYIDENYDEDSYAREANYLYNVIGFDTVDDVVKYYYIANDLKTFTVIDNLFELKEETITTGEGEEAVETKIEYYMPKEAYLAKFQEIIDDYENNYYSLYACDLLVTVDDDHNYEADDLTNANIDFSSLYTLINTKINDKKQEAENDDEDFGYTEIGLLMADIVDEYNKATVEDTTYGAYKKLGYKLSYSSINSGSIVSYSSYSDSLTDKLNTALKSMYDYMVTNNLNSTDNLKYYINSEMVKDEDGAHFLFSKFGTEKSSYEYDDSSDKYNVACNNEDEKCSVKQLAGAFYLELYNDIFTSAEDAEDDYNITDYPEDFPSTLDFDDMISELEDYFLTDSFVNTIFAENLSLSENDYYDRCKEIYQAFLDRSDN